MPDGAAPKQILSLGGRFGYEDQGQTPNTQLTCIDFGEAKMIFEDRGLVDGKTMKVTNEFYTTEGVVKAGKFFPGGKGQGEPIENAPARYIGNAADFPQFRRLCATPRSKRISGRDRGRASIVDARPFWATFPIAWDKLFPSTSGRKAFGGDKAAHEAFERMKEHLTDAAKLDLATSNYRLGRTLSLRRPRRTIRRRRRGQPIAHTGDIASHSSFQSRSSGLWNNYSGK